IDDREAFASRERFPEAEEVHAAEYEEIFPKLPINETSYLIIVTRGHRDDMRVLKLALATPARYIAMIGSKRKVIGVIRELEKEGVPRAAFERLHAPMGLDIGGISPEEIAISVTGDLALPESGAARDVVRLHDGRAAFLDIDDPGIVADIDAPAAYRSLIGAIP